MQTVARMSRLDRLITDRRLTAFIGAVAGIFVVLLFLPTLRGQIFTGGDLLDQNFPFRKFYADCLHSHQSFLWSPPFYGGFYLYGEGQTGMLHPLHLLLYTVSPLKLAFAIEFVSSYLFMLGGGYFLFRRWAMSPPAALFGAFIFTFGSVNLSRFQHMNAAAVAAHLPWILLSLERVFDAQTRRSRVLWSSGFALLIASQLLTGHPPAFYLSSIIAAWYLVYLLIARPSSTCLPAFFALLIGGALGLMIGAVQILPTLDVLRDSRFAEPTLAYLSLLSLKPAELLQWVNPFLWQAGHYEQTSYPYHELFIYSGGTVILLLFAWLLFQKQEADNRNLLSRFLAGLAVVGLFLALGRYNQVYSLYARWPVVNLFRIPSRYILLTQFALSAGAALAVDDLRKRSRILPFPVGAWILGGAMAVMSLATAALAILLKLPVSFSLRQNYPSLAALAEHVAPAGHVIGGAVLAIVGACLFLVSSRLPSVAQNGLVIFVLLDVLAIQGAILARHEYGDPFQIAETRRPPVPAPGPIQAPPIDDLPSILGYQLVNGYSGLNPAMLIPMHSRAYATLMGARVYWDDGWKAMPSPLSTLRVRHEAIAFNTPGLLLADIDFGKTALVEESVNLDPDATGQLQWIENTPGKLRLSGQATGNVLGTIGVRFHRGWKMTLDGQRHSILRVDGILLGFTLPAGQHEIELRFEPDDFYLGGRLTLLGIGGLVLYFLLGFYQGVLFT